MVWNARTVMVIVQVAPAAMLPPENVARLLTVLGNPVLATAADIAPQAAKVAVPPTNSRLLPTNG